MPFRCIAPYGLLIADLTNKNQDRDRLLHLVKVTINGSDAIAA
jgi:hypothetical protein